MRRPKLFEPIPKHGNFKDLTGHTYNRWTVLGYLGRKPPHHSRWLCLCSCGEMRVQFGFNLTKQYSKSCGCGPNKTSTTHGLSGHRYYDIWHAMMARCYNKDHKNYKHYGARGIKVVSRRWRIGEADKHPVLCFEEDMGDKPTPEHSLDRMDNDKGYSKKNCRWATKDEQAWNKQKKPK